MHILVFWSASMGRLQQWSYSTFPTSGYSWLNPSWVSACADMITSFLPGILYWEREHANCLQEAGGSLMRTKEICRITVQWWVGEAEKVSLQEEKGMKGGRQIEWWREREENGQENQWWERGSCSRLPSFLKPSYICFLVCELSQYKHHKFSSFS